jgi:hypothetical protein
MTFDGLYRLIMTKQISSSDEEYLSIINQAKQVKHKDQLDQLQQKMSKIVKHARDRAGYTIFPVYHGSAAKEKFTKFKKTKSYRDSGFMGYNEEVESPAFFFSNNAQMAHGFSINRADHRGDAWIHANLALRITNPLDLSGNVKLLQKVFLKLGIDKIPDKSSMWTLFDSEEYVAKIKSNGYDGAIISESDASKIYGIKDKNLTYVVFEPSQIKFGSYMAYDNGKLIPLSKRFDPNNEDMRY